jgi:hypothetical protein
MIAVFAIALFSRFRLAIVCSFPYASQKGAATANNCCRPLGNDIKASALHELRYWIDQGPLEPLRRFLLHAFVAPIPPVDDQGGVLISGVGPCEVTGIDPVGPRR